ncbi:MAG: FdhD protein [Candidatus Binatota bacterium]|jgi:FdhD protein|nr:FdhD protein [Candidatus Binatota bacterium]
MTAGSPVADDEDLTHSVSLLRIDGGQRTLREDVVAREEPLEIRIAGASLAVVMRTPGNDEDLVRGFLMTEGIVRDLAEVESIAHCSVAPDPDAVDNIVQVRLRAGVTLDLERFRRNLYATSSCGICGKATIERVLRNSLPLADSTPVDVTVFPRLPHLLRQSQAAFSATGGLHAAALFDGSGDMLVIREDVGRHNAVDKVIGWAAGDRRLPLAGHILMVSGRVSYEIVQKALAARIPVIAAVSAPSSLAIDLARSASMTLVGFLRGSTMNVYGDTTRVR